MLVLQFSRLLYLIHMKALCIRASSSRFHGHCHRVRTPDLTHSCNSLGILHHKYLVDKLCVWVHV